MDLNASSLTGGSQVLGLGGVSANVSGARQQQNTFYLDGADNSSIRLNEGLQAPNVEAIAEVQVVTNSNSAEYGRQPGGYFNIITKSGTNEVHGSGFFYFRDAALNANEWQRNKRPREAGRQHAADWRHRGWPCFRSGTRRFLRSYQRFTDQSTITAQPFAIRVNGDRRRLSEFRDSSITDKRLPIP